MGFKFKGTSRIYEQLRDEQKPKLVYGNPDDPCNVGPEQRQVFPARVKVTGKKIKRYVVETAIPPEDAQVLSMGGTVSLGNPGQSTNVVTTLPNITTAAQPASKQIEEVEVIENTLSLPDSISDPCSIDSLYDFTRNNRPRPGITDIQISVAGQFGMLLTADITYNVYTLEDFKRLERVFLRPNNRVDIDVNYVYGSTWDEKFADKNSSEVLDFKKIECRDMVIYKYEFNIKGGASFIIECKFSAMAQANTVGAGLDMFSSINVNTVPGLSSLKFKDGNRPISSPNDLIYYIVTKEGEKELDNVLKGNGKVIYNLNALDGSGLNEKLPSNALHSVVVYKDLPVKGLLATRRLGWWARNFTNNENSAIYITLGFLVNVLINKVILPAAIVQSNTNLAKTNSNLFTDTDDKKYNSSESINDHQIEFVCNNEFLRAPDYQYLCSGDPMKVVWVHSNDETEVCNKIGDYGVSKEGISVVFSAIEQQSPEDGDTVFIDIPEDAGSRKATISGQGIDYKVQWDEERREWKVIDNYVGTSFGETLRNPKYDEGEYLDSEDSSIATKAWLQSEKQSVRSELESSPSYDFSIPEDKSDRLAFTKLSGNSSETGFVDLTKILINLDEIIRIVESVREAADSPYKASSDKMSSSDTPTIKLSIESFLKKIFALIRDASGGLYDLDMVTWDDRKTKNITTIYLVNKKYNTLPANDQQPKPVVFESVSTDGVTLNTNISMTIPKDGVAMNAYAEGNLEGSTSAELSGTEDIGAAVAAHTNSINDILLKRVVYFGATDSDETGTDSLKAAVRSFVNSIPQAVIKKDGVIPYPLNIELTVDGINGFEFGDLINLSVVNQLTGYENTVFRVLNVTHTIDANNKWTTKLKTVCDLNPSVSDAKNYSEVINYSCSGDNPPVGSSGTDKSFVKSAIATRLDSTLFNPAKIGSSGIVSPVQNFLSKTYQNGRLPLDQGFMWEVRDSFNDPASNTGKFAGSNTLYKTAADAWNRLIGAAETAGFKIKLSAAYRTRERQQELYDTYKDAGGAAYPGWSPHGWGFAVDIGNLAVPRYTNPGQVAQFVEADKELSLGGWKRLSTPQARLYRWLLENGPDYGWYNPYRMAEGYGTDEAWHWEYWGGA